MYIRDSLDFIFKFEYLRLYVDCLLVSYDVILFYINMYFEELIMVVQIVYVDFDKLEYVILVFFIIDFCFFLRLVLENNIFEFNLVLYK